MPRRPHDTPSAAVAAEGQVLVDGPDGVAISFTPSAALRSAESIAGAARQAEEQKPRKSQT